jgi:hypothetical protein
MIKWTSANTVETEKRFGTLLLRVPDITLLGQTLNQSSASGALRIAIPFGVSRGVSILSLAIRHNKQCLHPRFGQVGEKSHKLPRALFAAPGKGGGRQSLAPPG